MKLLIHSQTSMVTVEVWEWISNFILHFIMDVITYPCYSMLVKEALGGHYWDKYVCALYSSQNHWLIIWRRATCKLRLQCPSWMVYRNLKLDYMTGYQDNSHHHTPPTTPPHHHPKKKKKKSSQWCHIINVMTSQITGKEQRNTKAPPHWPFVRGLHKWTPKRNPLTKGQ